MAKRCAARCAVERAAGTEDTRRRFVMVPFHRRARMLGPCPQLCPHIANLGLSVELSVAITSSCLRPSRQCCSAVTKNSSKNHLSFESTFDIP